MSIFGKSAVVDPLGRDADHAAGSFVSPERPGVGCCGSPATAVVTRPLVGAGPVVFAGPGAFRGPVGQAFRGKAWEVMAGDCSAWCWPMILQRRLTLPSPSTAGETAAQLVR